MITEVSCVWQVHRTTDWLLHVIWMYIPSKLTAIVITASLMTMGSHAVMNESDLAVNNHFVVSG